MATAIGLPTKYDSEDIGRDITAVLNVRLSTRRCGASMGGMGSLAAQRSSESQLYTAVSYGHRTPLRYGRRPKNDESRRHPEWFATLNEAADAISAITPSQPAIRQPA